MKCSKCNKEVVPIVDENFQIDQSESFPFSLVSVDCACKKKIMIIGDESIFIEDEETLRKEWDHYVFNYQDEVPEKFWSKYNRLLINLLNC